MVDIIEVKDWTSLKVAFIVDVDSLEKLKLLAEEYGEPIILRKKKEHIFFRGMSAGGVPVGYRYKG